MSLLAGREPFREPDKFEPGRFLATKGAQAALSLDEIGDAFTRHLRGDWGNLDPEDREQNERALIAGGRLFSAYTSDSGTRFWIITEADRSATTILLPSEY